MEESEWTQIFNNEMADFPWGDDWDLVFDYSIEPNNPASGWQQYIRHTGARFSCTTCRRTWPSNRVMVLFHMKLSGESGVVKTRPFRQNCKKCIAAKMVNPKVLPENIAILMENLVKKIRIKCYHENLGQPNRPPVNLDSRSPHEPNHCEACMSGICTRNQQ